MANSLKKLKQENKPWAKLKMSRKEYEIKKPWNHRTNGKKMSRDLFETCLLALDQEHVDQAIDEGHAEMLLREVFKKNF
jgi:hypothetical protein